MELTIPDELLRQTNLTEREMKIEIACRLFDAEKITLPQAGKLAGLERIDMEEELFRRKIPIYRPTVEDLLRDVEALKRAGV
jgi:predicted HTH domain antitoxin